MFRAPSRRDFLQIVLGSAALTLPSGVAALQRPPSHSPLAATALTDTLALISGAGGNVLVLDGPDGLLMINGGSADRTPDLMTLVAERWGGKPVRTLFNTDWHPAHTGSNEALRKAGAEIIAHEHTKQYLGADIFVDWQNRTFQARTALALPTRTFYATGTLTFGTEAVEYGHLGQAHTDGDIYVYLPGPNVLVAGDVLSAGTYPIADYTTGGWLGGLANATKTLLDLTNAETRVVPGAGPLQGRTDLQAQHEMLVALRDRLGKLMRQGMGADDILAAGATKDFDGRWGDPTIFLSTAYRGMWLHVRELGGVV